jgi:superfamily II DNA or RNA helicase
MKSLLNRAESLGVGRCGPRGSRRKEEAKVSRLKRPEGMSLEAWQAALRRQFGREQKYLLENLGAEPFFSEFHVTNPQTKATYRVAIRGKAAGENFCSCPDFRTNHLGTCKHIEFALAKLSRKWGGKAALARPSQPRYSEVYLCYGGRREVRFRAGRECPSRLAELASKYFDAGGLLLPQAAASFEKFLSASRDLDHEVRCYEDVLHFLAEVRDLEYRREKLKKAFPHGAASEGFQGLLRIPLYEYQKEGSLFAARAGRSLIGDEMGLGKTIQAMAAAEIMAGHLGVERVLVICPTSLKHQWQREIARFTQRSAQVIAGQRAGRERLFSSDSFYKITNYDTVHRDLDLIQGWSPDLVILDEAQRIKNWKTRAASAVKKISSPYAIVLTGTPLENRLEELVSIVQFVDQERLGPTYRFLEEHQVREESGRVVGYRELDRIGKTLEPILIRRKKKQVLDQLPERLDKTFFVPMTPEQGKHHEENREIVARLVAKWRRYRFLSETDQRRLMIALQNMRMSCDSTYLLDHQSDFGVKADELACFLEEVYEDPETKVVVFSQWLRMHELLVRRLEKRRWGYVLFHGGVPGPQRGALVDRFRDEEDCRAFLATDAGGVGLNLQHASVVVNVDIPWNPAVLEQRIGRVHRLGQRRPVRVVNFVAQGTIEEQMLSLLKFKSGLFAGVLDGGEKEVFLGGSRLSRFLETVDKVTGSIPAISADERADGPATPAASPLASRRDETDGGSPAGPRSSGAAAAWEPLLATGLRFLQEIAAASSPPRAPASPDAGGRRRARETGRAPQVEGGYLKIALPPPELIQQAMSGLQKLLAGVCGEPRE